MRRWNVKWVFQRFVIVSELWQISEIMKRNKQMVVEIWNPLMVINCQYNFVSLEGMSYFVSLGQNVIYLGKGFKEFG